MLDLYAGAVEISKLLQCLTFALQDPALEDQDLQEVYLALLECLLGEAQAAIQSRGDG